MAFVYLAEYVTFGSVNEMDEHLNKHMEKYYYNLMTSERAIITSISQHSLAYPGACHLKAETIAKALGISTKTVYRAIKKLSELGII